jgi:hypothetical protein
MSLWSDFVDTISVRTKEAYNAGLDVFGGVLSLGIAQSAPKAVPGAEEAIRDEVQKTLIENKKYDINLEQKSNDLILKTAVQLNDKIISPFITRPVSTLGLVTDVNSPLYQKGEYESGFQVSDIVDAYNRSAKVSPMQALTKSDLIPVVGPMSSFILDKGDIDIEAVNLWNDKSIQKNFSDNIVGKWYTGIGDFIVGNAALGAAGKVVGMGAKFAGVSSGLSTKGKSIAVFEKEINDGFKWADTNGAEGAQTVAASHMQELADSKDFTVITTLVNKYSTNNRIIGPLYQTTDREIAKHIILADKGNVDSMIYLADNAPDDLFEIADVAGQIRAKTLLDNELFIPDEAADPRLVKAFEAAIQRNPKIDELRKAFLDDNYQILAGGRTKYFPAEPAILKNQYIKIDKLGRAVKAEARMKDFDTFSTWADLTLPLRLGAPMTKLVKIVSRGAGLKPLGFVTFSGARPMDGYAELNAFLDDIDLFKDGSAIIKVGPREGQVNKVADIRKNFEKLFFQSADELSQVQAHKAIDEQIGLLIAYNNGWYETDKIKAAISYFRGKIETGAKSFEQKGYAIDQNGDRMTTNAETIRQMAESYRYTPWNDISREFVKMGQSTAKVGAGEVKKTAQAVYEDLMRIWTFDVLARPMFIVKQSIIEPLITVGLAGGMSEVRLAAKSVTMRGLTNARNAFFNKATRDWNKQEYAAINEVVTTKQTSLSRSIAIKNDLQAEYEALLSSKSPALREQHIAQVQEELKAAERLVDRLELDYRAAVKPLGIDPTVPSISLLERRLAYLEKNAPSAMKARLGVDIANAKAAISAHKGTLNSLAVNRKVIQDAEDAITKAYDDIDKAVGELSYAKRVQADTFGKSAEYRQAYVGKTSQYRYVPGMGYVDIDSFVNNANGDNFIRAMRAEASNASTTEMNYIGDLAVGTNASMIKRKVPNVPIDTMNPIYYQELAHVANDLIRRDPLMDLILGETPTKDLYRWALTSQGRSYLERFGVVSEQQIPGYIDDKVALVTRTFPSEQARAAILEREVRPEELQKWLSPYEDQLFDIAPSNWGYAETGVFGNKWYDAVNGLTSKATSWVFTKLTAPENPIREAFLDKIAIDKVAEKAAYLVEQGIPMTVKQWNALRQSAVREGLQELEKTVYTVRRQNRMLHAARGAVAFPTATLSAFYRYGRLAVKNPQRVAGFLYNYQRGFRTFGVDKNGNPTRNINEITHLIVPGTNDLGLGQYDEGFQLNARSLGFMLNMATPSFISAITVGSIMNKFEGSEPVVKKALGPLWEVWFPYGAPTSLTKQLTPPWANAAYNAVTGDMGKQDYLASYTSVYDYHKMLVEMGVEKKFPPKSQLELETQKLWEQKARWAFISPFGVPIKVQTNKMDLMDTLWYTLMNKYESQGKTYEEAKTLAGDEMLAVLGPKFFVDRVSLNPSNARLNVPETAESWNVIMKDNIDLVNKLATIRGVSNTDIRLVGLLTADMKVDSEERNMTVAKKLKDPNLVLPGSSKAVNGLKMTPEEIEKIRIKNRVWDQYMNLRKTLESQIKDGKPLRSHPELKKGLDYAAETKFKSMSQEWYDEFSRGANGDAAYEYARAFNVITSDKKFMDKHINSPFWQDVVAFNATRNTMTMIYNSLPDGDKRKAKLQDVFLGVIAIQAKNYHPELKRIIEQYFDNDSMKVAN